MLVLAVANTGSGRCHLEVARPKDLLVTHTIAVGKLSADDPLRRENEGISASQAAVHRRERRTEKISNSACGCVPKPSPGATRSSL